MPLLDPGAMSKSLDNDYGTTRGPNSAASHQLALFFDDPSLSTNPTDVEITGGGYARVTVNPADWLPADAGRKELATPAQFPATTAEWLESATHWGLYGSDGVWWDYGPLGEPLEVTGAGDGPLVMPVVFYDDSVATDAG